jgi:hypothetical protein
VIVSPAEAEWVRRIFTWFVVDRRSMDWIARELTRLDAPKDHRATTPGWHHDYVRRVLRNEKYVGLWKWGQKTNARDPMTGTIFQEDRPAEEVAKWTRHRPDLRIIDDELFVRAQVILDEERAKWAACHGEDGRFRGPRPEPGAARHLLQRAFRCGSCGRPFHVWGAFGSYLGCSGYRRGQCSVRTRLPRALAAQLLLQVIGDRLVNDREWFDTVVAEATRAWREREREVPTEVAELEKQIAADAAVIGRLTRAIESGAGEVEELAISARDRARQKKEREQKLLLLRGAAKPDTKPPTSEWIRDQVGRLHEILRKGGAEANSALRHLIGGAVELTEKEVPGRRRRYLVGTFSLRVAGPILPEGKNDQGEARSATADANNITIEFRELPPWAARTEEVKARVDAGLGYPEIAAALGWTEQWVAKARAWWYASRGLPVPDGRTEMARPDRPTMAETLTERVMPLWEAGTPIEEIAGALGCSRDIVRESVRQWHLARGLQVPDGRHRRREVNEARRRAAVGVADDDRAQLSESYRSQSATVSPGEPLRDGESGS